MLIWLFSKGHGGHALFLFPLMFLDIMLCNICFLLRSEKGVTKFSSRICFVMSNNATAKRLCLMGILATAKRLNSATAKRLCLTGILAFLDT